MSRSATALTLAAAFAAGLALAAPASIAASSASSPTASAAKKKRCGHRYLHKPPRRCPGRRAPRPTPPKAKPKPSPTAPAGTGEGGGSGGGATTPAPTTPASPGAGASPGGGAAPGPGTLPRRLGVDETEYSVTPSYNPVAAGNLEFNVTNFGMDDHNLAIRKPGGQIIEDVDVAPGKSRTFSVNLPAGTYTLLCSLYDHEQLGMKATLRVQ